MTEQNWKDTVLLPQTEFPMRGSLAQREPVAIAAWEEAKLYQRLVDARPAEKRFVFHDGPPYANGNIHHGHALNKILKDFVVKYHLLAGYRATHTPGWDCHGLPIEQKVDEELGGKKREMDITEFRKACRAYADRWVGEQRDQFKRLMVFADWENPYRTMDYSYEATIVRELGKFMKDGYVFRGRKPVHWSWAAVTALADAEVEYAPYDAHSVYVKFSFTDAPDWLKTHYQFQIRTFWILLLYLVIASILCLILIGFLLFFLIAIWWIVRCVKGLKYLDQGAAYPDHRGWLF